MLSQSAGFARRLGEIGTLFVRDDMHEIFKPYDGHKIVLLECVSINKPINESQVEWEERSVT